MTFTLVYHHEIDKDVGRINRNLRKRIGRAIQERLATHPESYGKPLRGSLAGFWSLRVGDYRVVYKIHGRDVWVLAVIDRRDVYEDVMKRLSWQP